MKKQLKTLFATLSFSVIILSCKLGDLQVPKEVRLKTKAKYEFSVLDFDTSKENSKFKLSDYLDIGKMLEEKAGSGDDDSSMAIYKYNDGTKESIYQQFLVHMSLPETQFDLSETFQKMDFSQSMSGFDLNKEFEGPSIPDPVRTQEIDMSDIRETLNTIVTCFGETSESEGELTFCSTPTNFSTIEYESGYFVVEGEGETIPDDATVTLKKGTSLIGQATFKDNKAEIDVTGKTINHDGMIVIFSGTTGQNYKVTAKTGTRIKKATGVTIANLQVNNITPITFTSSLPATITNCVGEQGTLKIEFKTPSTGWSQNILDDYSVELSGGIQEQGGGNVTCTKDNPAINLATTTVIFTNEAITAKPDLTLNFDNSNIDFTKKPTVTVTIDIKKLSATVKLDNTYSSTIDGSQTIGTDITDYVESIIWNPSGFDVTAKNTLPAGNDITLQFSSTFLGMTGEGENVKKTITAGGLSAKEKVYNFRGVETSVDLTSTNTADITGTIGLPGYSTSNKTFDVQHVEPGKTYAITMSVTPVLDFKEAEVKLPPSLSSGYTGQMSVGLNKKTLFDSVGENLDFADKLNISALPLYIYASVPDTIFTGLGFKAKMESFYGTKQDDGSIQELSLPADSKRKLLYGTGTVGSADYKPLALMPLPEFKKNAKEEVLPLKTIPEAISLAESINDPADTGTLCIDYDVQLEGSSSGTITVTKQQIEQLKANGKTSIKIDIVLVLTMNFKVNADDFELDLMKIMKKGDDKDLFGRETDPGSSAYEQYIDLITSAEIIIEEMKLPVSGNLELKLALYGENSKPIELKNGKISYSVKPKEILKWPFIPSAKITCGKNKEIGLLREMAASGKINLKFTAEGEIPIYPFEGQN